MVSSSCDAVGAWNGTWHLVLAAAVVVGDVVAILNLVPFDGAKAWMCFGAIQLEHNSWHPPPPHYYWHLRFYGRAAAAGGAGDY